MATDDDDFKIKGAASNPSSRKSSIASPPPEKSQPDATDDVKSATAATAEEVNSNDSDSDDEGEIIESAEDLAARYRWFISDTTPPSDYKYYFHADTNEWSWYPPNEPYWVWDTATGLPDPIGLQYPPAQVSREEALELNKTEEPEVYTGYNPKIHGNYDPNADYAQYHKQKRAEEAAAAAAANPFGTLQATASGTAMYESTMKLNRFTGHVQSANLNPDRHSDQAKSGRQMNAFFDVDAAANAHGGNSSKAERQNQKLSKKEVEEFRRAKKEKKRKKQMAFLLN